MSVLGPPVRLFLVKIVDAGSRVGAVFRTDPTNMEKSTIDFLKKLRRNNNREWFQDNKPLYQAAVADFTVVIEELIAAVAKFDPLIGTVKAKDCLFRVFRDVRFSKDKSPYKSNFGAAFGLGGRKGVGDRGGYYLHVEPGGKSFIGGGMYMPPSDVLQRLRESISEDPRPLRKVVAAAGFRKTFGELRGEQLKRIPRGFDKEDPAEDLLRMKSFTAWHNLYDEDLLAKDFVKKAAASCKQLKPLLDYINKATRP